jgi:hypothetical protein
MLPPKQGLGTDQTAIRSRHLRLVGNAELPVAQAVAHIPFDPQRAFLLGDILGIEKGHAVALLAGRCKRQLGIGDQSVRVLSQQVRGLGDTGIKFRRQLHVLQIVGPA